MPGLVEGTVQSSYNFTNSRISTRGYTQKAAVCHA